MTGGLREKYLRVRMRCVVLVPRETCSCRRHNGAAMRFSALKIMQLVFNFQHMHSIKQESNDRGGKTWHDRCNPLHAASVLVPLYTMMPVASIATGRQFNQPQTDTPAQEALPPPDQLES
ncbi:hypothetical protein BaRGS_00031711 [Batillaria attramentaria]|uniref:Uncharacterized protein n=1 Tax=Batillaria attramentaria TaxID=370345 RepID=A0ABD0JQL1_9CAEN